VSLIDELLPKWHFREVHRVFLRAPRDVVMRSAMEVTWSEIPFAELLMKLTRNDMTTYRKIIGDISDDRRLAANDNEVVFGGVGGASGPPELADPRAESFRAFDEPGYKKIVLNIKYADGVLSTETRILTTDPDTKRQFFVYWVIIRLGSGFIRNSVLFAIRRRVRREMRKETRSEA
jgi:hypothetical protein